MEYGVVSGPTWLPPEITYLMSSTQTLVAGVKQIYDNWSLHPPWPLNVFRTAWDYQNHEAKVKALNLQGHWGIQYLGVQEHHRPHIEPNDGVDVLFFGERMLGFSNSGYSDREAWQDEMYLRTVRGFANWAHGKGLKVGICTDFASSKWFGYIWGDPAFNFVNANYDWVWNYIYNSRDVLTRTEMLAHFDWVDQKLPNPMKFFNCIGIYPKAWSEARKQAYRDNYPENLRWQIEQACNRGYDVLTCSTLQRVNGDRDELFNKIVEYGDQYSEVPPPPPPPTRDGLANLIKAGGLLWVLSQL